MSRATTPLLRIVRTRGIRLIDLAAESGLTPNATRRIVAGKVRPSLETALRLSEALGVEVEEMFPSRRGG